MYTQDPSFEASLLFEAPVPDALAHLAGEFETIAMAHEVPAVRRYTDDPSVLLFDCGPIQVLVAGCDQPMEVAHFLDAGRPGGATVCETEMLSRLTSHRYSVTILVSDNDDAPQPDDPDLQELKRALCWQLAEAMPADAQPSLVFWCETDMLYAGEEFPRANILGTSHLPAHELLPSPAMVRAGAQRSERQRALEARALTFIQTQIIQGKHRPIVAPHPVVSAVNEGLQRAAPVALAAIEATKANRPHVMRGATMACSTAAMGICLLPQLMNGII
ncbi:hypothetical protein P1J78_07265 [Psychromarinibacter sp. C21-152]|uniref:Uncharacterized protein n=1 Tax=Psychromarinibacter sediminicola TaxID=3033385 RepID=A0AAE3NRY7_9RHOB|nr:hypothetical protein [Psychromarinibacter sediminicola]MDF0600524.1 hypothetical protein [Psychromarinibacter sediminicola]